MRHLDELSGDRDRRRSARRGRAFIAGTVRGSAVRLEMARALRAARRSEGALLARWGVA